MTRENHSDDAAAHALDALSNEERAGHERALEHDAELRVSQAGFDAVSEQLADAAPPIAPPADMKARLMASLAELPQHEAESPTESADDVSTRGPEPHENSEPERQGSESRESDAAPHAESPTPAERRARRRWYTRPVTIVVAAAAASALIFAGGAAVGTLVTENTVSTQSAAADKLAAINAASDVQRTSIQADGTSATVVWSESLELSAVVMDGLPSAPDGNVYEAWYIGESGAVAAGTFDADSDTTWHVLDGAFTPGTVIGITVEPDGGSEQPTTDPIMVFETA